MIKIYTRDQGEEQLSKHFKAKEFFCKCGKCHNQLIDDRLIYKLELLRTHLQKPIKINSGYRCEVYNKQIGGKINSQHCKGKAADVACLCSVEAELINFKGVGIYKTFTHLDVREERARWNG